MRILMRNTVFKTAALAGLFLCLLAFAGVFSGITTSAHAMHGYIHANEVGTDETKLKEFVQAAVDAYYIDEIIRQCDFSTAPFAALITQFGIDLATAPIEQIRPLIGRFSAAGLSGRSDLEAYCDFTQRFDEVFGREDGDWKSGPIYLFIADDQGNMLYHGANPDSEGERIEAVDEGGRNVRQLIVNEAETPMNAGIVNYCWDDPTTDSDDIAGNDPETAPGDSWKTSYVVDPFEYLAAPALSASPGVIFGSGIYPKTGTPPQGCDGNGMADGGDGMEPEPEPEPVADSVGGGGCAIAAGTDSTPRSNAFNLVLIVSALLFTVSLGNRAMGRRNRISS